MAPVLGSCANRPGAYTLPGLAVPCVIPASSGRIIRAESLNALVGQRTAKVDRWTNSSQKQRWLAAALLDIEPRLRRIRGYRYLPLLRSALQAEMRGEETTLGYQAA